MEKRERVREREGYKREGDESRERRESSNLIFDTVTAVHERRGMLFLVPTLSAEYDNTCILFT